MPVIESRYRLSESLMRFLHLPGYVQAAVMGTLISLVGLGLSACGPEQSTAPQKVSRPSESPSTTAENTASDKPVIDPLSVLVIDEGWELVRGTCAACHSATLVTQNRGSRETWKEMIRWMQETQGLWPLDPQTEGIILDYLAKNYPPAASSRRAPLPTELMPENPYQDKGP